jgi:hypothetical protein
MGNQVRRQQPSRKNSHVGTGPDTRLPSATEQLLLNARSQLFELHRLLMSLSQVAHSLQLDWPSLERAGNLCSQTWMNATDALQQHQFGVYSPEELKHSWLYISEDTRQMLKKSDAWVSPSLKIVPKLKGPFVGRDKLAP